MIHTKVFMDKVNDVKNFLSSPCLVSFPLIEQTLEISAYKETRFVLVHNFEDFSP